MEDKVTTCFGTINGKRALFEYQEDEKGQRLIWREQHQGDSTTNAKESGTEEECNIIAAEDIIAVVMVNTNYHILTIEHIATSPSSKPDASASESRCRALVATNLPLRFLDHFLVKEPPPHLACPSGPNNEPNIHVLISRNSGTGKAVSFFDNILQPTLAALGISETAYRVHHTRSAQTITELTKNIFLPRAQKGISQTLILLSGDGGPHDIVNALALSSDVDKLSSITYQAPIIGLLALGTGNALAHSLGLLTKSSTSLGLRTFLLGTPRPLPVFRAHFSPGSKILTDEGRTAISIPRRAESDHHHHHQQQQQQQQHNGVIYGAVVLSYGLHASLVAESDTPEFRKHGSQRFKMAAQELLFPHDGSAPHTYKAKLSILKKHSNNNHNNNNNNNKGEEEEEWIDIPRQEHAYILNTLVSNLEEKFTISPLSSSQNNNNNNNNNNKGKMYLIHFGPMISGDQIMHIMSLAYQGGKHVELESVGYEEVEGVRIELLEEDDERWRRICVDGTIVRLEKRGWVEVRRNEDAGEPTSKGNNNKTAFGSVQLVQP